MAQTSLRLRDLSRACASTSSKGSHSLALLVRLCARDRWQQESRCGPCRAALSNQSLSWVPTCCTIIGDGALEQATAHICSCQQPALKYTLSCDWFVVAKPTWQRRHWSVWRSRTCRWALPASRSSSCWHCSTALRGWYSPLPSLGLSLCWPQIAKSRQFWPWLLQQCYHHTTMSSCRVQRVLRI